jgi:PP-loop superfamily ATP-utilizing enzyme
MRYYIKWYDMIEGQTIQKPKIILDIDSLDIDRLSNFLNIKTIKKLDKKINTKDISKKIIIDIDTIKRKIKESENYVSFVEKSEKYGFYIGDG